jgi:long-chain acyl-CoA synthetase
MDARQTILQPKGAMNLYQLFEQNARERPDHPAIIAARPPCRLSYAELNRAIRAAGSGLQRAGLSRGDCVGLHHSSGADYIVLTYAVWSCGGCVVPIPPELAPREKQQICRDIAMQFVISEPASASFADALHRGPAAELFAGTALMPITAPREVPAGLAALDPAFIRFTSGTTGASKGVVLSHETIRDRVDAANAVLRIGPDDRVVWLLSMSYHFAVTIAGYLSCGATILLPANHFASAVLNAARDHGATLIYGSPAHFTWMAEAAEACPLPSLRFAISTTAALPATTGERFHRRFGLPVTQALGIIEVGLPFINADMGSERPGAVGRLLPAYRLRLVDVGFGPKTGEVLLSGPGLLDAYYEPWRTRRDIMPDGWFHTGDVGELDADGCMFLRGRTKELISVLGMKFFPQEVEAVLRAHPQVECACVCARPDDRLGEVPTARVVPRGVADPALERALIAHCREQLAAYKVPQQIEFVKELRRTASGKLLRRDVAPELEVIGNACEQA